MYLFVGNIGMANSAISYFTVWPSFGIPRQIIIYINFKKEICTEEYPK